MCKLGKMRHIVHVLLLQFHTRNWFVWLMLYIGAESCNVHIRKNEKNWESSPEIKWMKPRSATWGSKFCIQQNCWLFMSLWMLSGMKPWWWKVRPHGNLTAILNLTWSSAELQWYHLHGCLARSQGFSSLDVTLPRAHLSSTSRCAFCCCIINAISVPQTQMVKEA